MVQDFRFRMWDLRKSLRIYGNVLQGSGLAHVRGSVRFSGLLACRGFSTSKVECRGLSWLG